ncbi:MAG: hypothetical protein L0Z62_19005 [Gemmataceae bacterium]|nr:hypothetical protein [Gemmataceae bacterium]
MRTTGGGSAYAWVAGGLAVLLLLGGGVGWLLVSQGQAGERCFCAKRWQHGDARERGRMVRDLMDGGWLGCLTREEILRLLGNPDVDHGEEVGYSVDTGVRFGSAPWNYHLMLLFDDLGQLLSAELRD